MKLFHKIALGALFVAMVPLAALGFRLIAEQRGTMARLIAAEDIAEADATADRIARQLQEVAARIAQTLRLVEPTALSAAERQGLLRAVYRQSPDIVAVAWAGADGALKEPLVALRPDEVDASRFAVSADNQKQLLAAIAKLATSKLAVNEVALSPPVHFAGRREPSLLLTTAIDARDRLVVEVALRGPEKTLERFRPADGRYAALLDASGAVVVGSVLGMSVPPLPLGPSVRFMGSLGDPMIGAIERVENTPLSVVVFQGEAQAFAAVRQMKNQTLEGLLASALLSILGGYFLSTTLRRRLSKYEEGARAFGRGELEKRVEDSGDDELGLLAKTLNQMATDLGSSRREIEAWNKELQARVEARTQELKSAQERLVLAARLSAVGHLGAGVAHEIGNPLARIIGHAQLLQLEEGLPDETKASLKGIEVAARRANDITKSLLRFSETQSAPAVPDVSLDACADEAVDFVRSQYESLGVVIKGVREGGVVTGKKAQIVQAIFQLLDNSKNAYLAKNAAAKTVPAKVSTITLDVRGKQISVADEGTGIAPEHQKQLFDPFFTTKTVWENPGLGLSLVYRTMQEHQGRVEVDSALDKGTKVTLVF